MWELWSSALELLGRIRLRLTGRTRLRVGDPGSGDAQGSGRWRSYLSAERLYDTWGPVPDSVWSPFHCVPLFAAIDRIPDDSLGPTPEDATLQGPMERPALPVHARPGAPAPAWLRPGEWTILDLPGRLAVEAAVWLITSARCQPVCTFDNWPHPKGLLRAEHTLAELLRWAGTVEDARTGLTTSSPPLWICDSERLGTRVGSPGEFDNRYYLDDSILPAPALLATAGVTRVNYLTLGETEVPLLDLEPYFAELLSAGFPIYHVDLADPLLSRRNLASVTARKPVKKSKFRRSAAGGFGTEVPEPSSGSSG